MFSNFSVSAKGICCCNVWLALPYEDHCSCTVAERFSPPSGTSVAFSLLTFFPRFHQDLSFTREEYTEENILHQLGRTCAIRGMDSVGMGTDLNAHKLQHTPTLISIKLGWGLKLMWTHCFIYISHSPKLFWIGFVETIELEPCDLFSNIVQPWPSTSFQFVMTINLFFFFGCCTMATSLEDLVVVFLCF